MDKAYDPAKVEKKWYEFWEKNNLFHAETDSSKNPFTIVIPPPNVTGVLHMGHGLNNTLQDVAVRWKRMQGFNALWVPGTDHAGIATQNVVEKQLAREGRNRYQVGRERFIERVWEWRKQYGSTIINQLRTFGASCDWQRERFTMDEGLSRAVREVFVRLYDEGLIYRGKYIINWCPRCRTALADEEVEHESESGYLYHVRYPLAGDGGQAEKDAGAVTNAGAAQGGAAGTNTGGIVVATTRPETMLGDTAVAVHPEDERYKRYIGKTLILPLVGREIPVVADPYVEREFGTGAVKITPAHDPNDFELGLRHGLDQVNVMNEDATMNENAVAECVGMDRYECREVVLEELRKQGLLVKEEAHAHEVGHCYRCATVVEPWLSEQWFVKMKPLAEPAIKAVETGEVTFHPERWRKVYLNWMYNIRDWCISRQIWWGHRIPVYYCECGKTFASVEHPETCPACGGSGFRQDEDVLDTWFSSQLWPFSTLGWPEATDDLEYFYPTSLLVTDPGILFFWVARMIMSGIKFMGRVPFGDVYIHGVVMDAKGRKMSKSLGNGIDPLEVVEQFGADAMRYTIVNITPLGQNLLLSMDKFQIGARFANKIWNASRYILMNIEGVVVERIDESKLDTAEAWILSRYRETAARMNTMLGEYRLGDASSLIYDFFWHDLCDWYIEISKVNLYSDDPGDKSRAASMLVHLLDGCMRLLHPLMPFITEEIWQRLPLPEKGETGGMRQQPVGDGTGGPVSIMVADYPDGSGIRYPQAEETMATLQEIVYAIRNIRGEMNVPPELKARVLVRERREGIVRIVNEHREVIKFLARLDEVEAGPGLRKPQSAASAVGSGFELYLPLKDLIDLDQEKTRLAGELEKIEADVARSRAKLDNPDFVTKAPVQVVETEKSRLADHEKNRERVRSLLSSLG
jgi:valyl-tRNA synthetase